MSKALLITPAFWDPLKSMRKIDTSLQKEDSFEPLTAGH